MIFTDRAAKEKISGLESRITELEADIITKDSAVETMQADITTKDQTIAEHVASIGTLNESITALNTEKSDITAKLDSANLALAAKDKEIAEAKASAGKEATQILASIGQTEPLATEDKPSDEIKNLTGFAKVSAAFAKKK